MNHSTIIEHLDTLYSAVVCDILDDIGYREQTLSRHIRPLTHASRICGRIKTAQAIPVSETPKRPYELLMKMMDEVEVGDVICINAGSDETSGLWGELLSTAASYCGCNGVVMSACSRDLQQIEEMGFPVFGIGAHPADSKARVDFSSIGEPINISGVRIVEGDYVIGDCDGTVIIPSNIIEKVILKSLEKVSGENVARDDLRKGVPLSTVFERYGIL